MCISMSGIEVTVYTLIALLKEDIMVNILLKIYFRDIVCTYLLVLMLTMPIYAKRKHADRGNVAILQWAVVV